MLKVPIGILISLLIFSQTFAQDTPAQKTPNPQDEVGVKIYENYKDCVVDLTAEVAIGDGQKLTMGGSGFFIDRDGYLLTNAHVIKSKNDEVASQWGTKLKITGYSYWITQPGKNKKYKAELIGFNPYCDLALLKAVNADPKDFTVAKLGDSDKLRVGEKVYALGMPLGMTNSFTGGRVSGLHRHLGLHYVEDFIQTDAAINPGNSGSPLINANNEVIGINGALMRGANGIGFAIPIKMINLEQLKGGEVKLSWLGLEAMMTNFPRTGTHERPGFKDLQFLHEQTGIDDLESLRLLAKLTKDSWALVNFIDEIRSADDKVSPAKRGGFKRGDLITKIGSQKIKSGMDVRLATLNTLAGQPIEIELLRVNRDAVQHLKIIVTLEKSKNDSR